MRILKDDLPCELFNVCNYLMKYTNEEITLDRNFTWPIYKCSVHFYAFSFKIVMNNILLAKF